MIIQCEKCEYKFNAETAKIAHKKEFKVKGYSIFLTYYDCPSCGRRHYVQIDDIISLGKLREVENQFVKLAKLKKAGQSIPKKTISKFNKTRKDLSNYRINLMKHYTGEKIFDNTVNDYVELRFSI